MTPSQAVLVQDCWRRAEPVAETIARLFYRRLFQLAPELRDRFRSSLCEHCDHLIDAAEQLVCRIGADAPASHDDTPSGLDPHQATLIDAWLWAIENQVGGSDTHRVGRAWRDAIASEAGVAFRTVALGDAESVAA